MLKFEMKLKCYTMAPSQVKKQIPRLPSLQPSKLYFNSVYTQTLCYLKAVFLDLVFQE